MRRWKLKRLLKWTQLWSRESQEDHLGRKWSENQEEEKNLHCTWERKGRYYICEELKNGKKESHNNDVCFLREWNNKESKRIKNVCGDRKWGIRIRIGEWGNRVRGRCPILGFEVKISTTAIKCHLWRTMKGGGNNCRRN